MPTFQSFLQGPVVLAAIFIVSVLMVGGRVGARILAVLAICLIVIALSGWACTLGSWAVVPSLLLCSLIVLAVHIAGLLPEKRLCGPALAGGALALAVPLVLGALGVWQLKLTGAFSSTLADVWYGSGTHHIPQHYIVAGQIVLIGVGAVADLAIAVTSVMAEIQNVKPEADASVLYKAGIRLGGDVTGTEVNSLVYAMLGLHFGAILLPFARPDAWQNAMPWIEVGNRQFLAVDMLAALAGTAGLLVAIPATAWIGSRILRRRTS